MAAKREDLSDELWGGKEVLFKKTRRILEIRAIYLLVVKGDGSL
jgi:hypothetical protein